MGIQQVVSDLIRWISQTLSSINLLWNLLSLASSYSLSLIRRPFFKLFSHLPSPRLSSSLPPGSACSLVPPLLVNWTSSQNQKIYHWRGFFLQYKEMAGALELILTSSQSPVQSKEAACPSMSLPICNKCLISKKPCVLYVLQGPSSIRPPAFL